MEIKDTLALLHPTIAIVFVFPLIGIVINYSWLTRQRRLEALAGEKSKIPPNVGSQHLKIGYWLSCSVVGVALLGMAFPIISKMIARDVLAKEPFRVVFVAILFAVTIAAMVFLIRSNTKIGKGTFATLSGMGLVILGSQPEIFRRDSEWMFSHYYYGIASALLMIFSVAIVQDIYKDRQNRWRKAHILLNILASLLFIGQGMTGARDLLSIPYSWQESYLSKCDFKNKICPQNPPQINSQIN